MNGALRADAGGRRSCGEKGAMGARAAGGCGTDEKGGW